MGMLLTAMLLPALGVAGMCIASDFDPVDSLQFSPLEMAVTVQAASDRGTYV